MKTWSLVLSTFLFSAAGFGQVAPPHLATWGDLDLAVAAEYGKLTNASSIYPPGALAFGLSSGYFTFEPDGELSSITNLCGQRAHFGMDVWSLNVAETQAADRVWLYTGLNGSVFRTNALPLGFDPQAWSRNVYGQPPAWLSSTGLARWYAERERSRLGIRFSLVATNDWLPFVQANLAAATNSAEGTFRLCVPADTNRVAFAALERVADAPVRLWLYSPTNPLPLDIFRSLTLPPPSNRWSLVGGIDADAAFRTWETDSGPQAAYFRAARADTDGDYDGIPDGREFLLFGTDPVNPDSDGDGLSDREEAYRYVTDPNWRDTDSDGMWDGWEIVYGYNPFIASDALLDPDGDGLGNLGEFLAKSDPLNTDTDGDHMPDGWEVGNGLDPVNPLDAIGDPDRDMVPNSYEYAYGTDPCAPDSQLIPRLRVDPAAPAGSNVFATVAGALDGSYPYAVIEVAAGRHVLATDDMAFFPPYPVMVMSDNWGTSRLSRVEYGGGLAAFYMNDRQDNRTIVRGLTLALSGRPAFQIGFWLGAGDVVSTNGASPVFDGVTVELGESDVNIGYFCRHAMPEPVVFNNCVIRCQPGKSPEARGIYAVDSPDLCLRHCSFLGFSALPVGYGIQFESSPNNNGHAADPVHADLSGCVWDSSFGQASVFPYVRLEESVEYVVSVSDCAVPAVKTEAYAQAERTDRLWVTNTPLAAGGHLGADSPCAGRGPQPLTWYDFEGQPRDNAPDIGADEYAGAASADSDGDGLPDAAEILDLRTDPYDADSDNDAVPDGVEVAGRSDPLDAFSYRVAVTGAVTNETSLSAPVYVSYALGDSGWNGASAVAAAQDGSYALDVVVQANTNAPWLYAYCDFNTNAVPDASEPVYAKRLAVTGAVCRVDFLLRDFDGDGMPDGCEAAAGTDPADRADYRVAIEGSVTYATPFRAMNLVVGYGFQTNGQSLAAVAAVDTNGAFAFPAYTASSTNGIWLHLFDDADTNGAVSGPEAFITRRLAVTGSVSRAVFTVGIGDCDKDLDGMLDFWEVRQGLSWTNRLDAALNPDGDPFVNLHEYWIQGDPRSADTNANYAFIDAIRAVDDRIAGLNPTNAVRIFSVQDHAATNYVRNPACWAADIDLTCCSPWNSYAANQMAGTLISPRHVLFAAHFDGIPANGQHVLRFVDRQNNVITRRLIAKTRAFVFDENSKYPDLTVGLLECDVPTNQINFAKVLPDNYEKYICNGCFLPDLRFDQEEKSLVGQINSVANLVFDERSFAVYSLIGEMYNNRAPFFEAVVGGDSGNPSFLVLQESPVILTVWSGGGPGTGTSITALKSVINQMMIALDILYSGDPSKCCMLSEIDLSEFQSLDVKQ